MLLTRTKFNRERSIAPKQWHQTWTDNTGLLLQLSGQVINGSMVMTGNTVDKNKAVILNRITWTANTNGTVRQHWQTSADNGQHWLSRFDGTYTRVE